MVTNAAEPPTPRKVHYGWAILAVSVLTVLGSIGLARFGYTLILPAMQDALELTNAQTGGLATANFLGYLVLAVVGGNLASRFGPRWVVGASMIVTGIGMVLTGTVTSYETALVWRFLTGAGSGGANVPVMSLLPAWFAPRRRGFATGIAVGGTSVGLVLMGPLVPRILDGFVPEGWRYSWFVLGGLVLLLGIFAVILLRDDPKEKGLLPLAGDVDESQGSESLRERGSVRSRAAESRGLFDWATVYRSGAMWHLALVYVAFGFSYVIYSTFFAKYLIAEGGYTRQAAAGLWAVVGWISILSGLAWGSISDAIGRKGGLVLVYLVQMVSFAAFALWTSRTGYAISVVAFGLAGWSIPGIVAAACGDYVGPGLAPAAFGFVTLFFGLGQAAGPSIAGVVADAVGSFRPAFLLAAGIALLGAVGSLLMRPPRTAARPLSRSG